MSKNACIYLGDVHDGIKVDIADAAKKSDDSGNPFRKTNRIKFLRLVKDNNVDADGKKNRPFEKVYNDENVNDDKAGGSLSKENLVLMAKKKAASVDPISLKQVSI
jgi:hypothetical protein